MSRFVPRVLIFLLILFRLALSQGQIGGADWDQAAVRH